MEKWKLPDGWGWKKLDKLCVQITDGTHITPKYQNSGVRFISIQNLRRFQPIDWDSYVRYISVEEHKELTKRVKPEKGDVLLSKIGTLGLAKVIDFDEEVSIFVGLALLKPKHNMLDSKYLEAALNSPSYVELAYQSARGAGRKTLPLVELKKFEIPIPYPEDPPRSLETQRRIVARLEALLAEVQETRQLRCSILDDANLLGQAIFFRGEWEATMQRMGELVSQKPLDVIVNDETEYLFAGVKSFGRGVFPSKSKKGFETSYRQLTRLSTGDFTYPKLMAWEGALGIVSPECDGMVVSPEFPVFQVHTNKILPEVLDVYFKTPSIWERLAALSTGSNARRRRLHPNAFLDYEFPVPPKHIQQQIHEAHVFLTEYKKSYNDDENSLGILEQTFLAQAFRGEL